VLDRFIDSIDTTNYGKLQILRPCDGWFCCDTDGFYGWFCISKLGIHMNLGCNPCGSKNDMISFHNRNQHQKKKCRSNIWLLKFPIWWSKFSYLLVQQFNIPIFFAAYTPFDLWKYQHSSRFQIELAILFDLWTAKVWDPQLLNILSCLEGLLSIFGRPHR